MAQGVFNKPETSGVQASRVKQAPYHGTAPQGPNVGPGLVDMGDLHLLIQMKVNAHWSLSTRCLFVGLALFFSSYLHHLSPLSFSLPSLNPNVGGSKVGIPSEELGSWKNSGRRRIWKSG